MFSPLRERNYRLWAASDIVSIGGTWMQVLGLNWLVLSATGSATAMGLIVMLQSLPVLLLGSWGGALADRLPSRPVLVISQAIRAALSVALVAATVAGSDALWPIYGVALLSGVISSIEGPALGRFGSALVPRDSLAPALALGSVLSSGGRIVGMALGGVLVGLSGPGVLFAINAASFGVVILALGMMRPAEMYPLARAEAGSADAGVRAGLRYLFTQPVVLVILALAFVIGSLGRNYQVTMAAMVAGPLHGGAGGYGITSTVFAVGAVLGGLLLASTGRATHRVLIVAGAVISVLQLFSAAAPNLITFSLLILPIAAGAVIFDTVVCTRIQLDTREDMRGRILASLGLVSSLAGIVGAPVLGWLCDALGARGALGLAGAVTTVAAVVGALVLARVKGVPVPALRTVRRGLRRVVRRRVPVVPPVTTAVVPTDAVVPARSLLTAAAVVAAPAGPSRRPLTGVAAVPAPPAALPHHGSTHPGPSRPVAPSRPAVLAHAAEQPARRRRSLLSFGTGRRGRTVTDAVDYLDRPVTLR
ncbi:MULTISPECIES: MFS transporter [Catenuloplanes]|uniref:MFS family permease n=1 Tax=Catenuloplanes niger TaxID=587534 RepID=A0AAE4CSJ5_9ACTN|nr:MFS transporter [Catenuloplanes niger]MDR7324251.1 MFS family permease [Catenuloplanes niger]